MEGVSLIKSVELEDSASPRSARYIIRLGRLTEGYVVETVWGGALDRKHHESYFRPTLAAAEDKFERILAAKAGARRSGRRHYVPAGDEEAQLAFVGFASY